MKLEVGRRQRLLPGEIRPVPDPEDAVPGVHQRASDHELPLSRQHDVHVPVRPRRRPVMQVERPARREHPGQLQRPDQRGGAFERPKSGLRHLRGLRQRQQVAVGSVAARGQEGAAVAGQHLLRGRAQEGPQHLLVERRTEIVVQQHHIQRVGPVVGPAFRPHLAPPVSPGAQRLLLRGGGRKRQHFQLPLGRAPLRLAQIGQPGDAARPAQPRGEEPVRTAPGQMVSQGRVQLGLLPFVCPDLRIHAKKIPPSLVSWAVVW